MAAIAVDHTPCCVLSPGVLGDAVVANPLLGSDPPWSFWEAETRKHSRLGNLRHTLCCGRWPQTLSGGVGQAGQRIRWENAEGES